MNIQANANTDTAIPKTDVLDGFTGVKRSAEIENAIKEFTDIFNSMDKSKKRFEIFSDFVTLFACSIRNSMQGFNKVLFNKNVEDEYMKIIGKYSKEDAYKFSSLCALTVIILTLHGLPHDVLGDLYMSFEFGEKRQGQYFTPSAISELMARIEVDAMENTIKTNGFVTISDSSCGAGSTLMGAVSALMNKKYDPLKTVFLHGVDIDRLVALMCYVQLSLWNIPAHIIVGDSLTQNFREHWYTPAFYLGGWAVKLKLTE